MTSKQSAGILSFRRGVGEPVEVLLVHPGGPFWKNKDAGAWSIPKGEFAAGEDALSVARREFSEETGFTIDGQFIALAPVRQRGGKTVHAFAVEGDFDASTAKSNTFAMEWPPKSGKVQEFPEIDRAAWFCFDDALVKINAGQVALLQELREILAAR